MRVTISSLDVCLSREAIIRSFAFFGGHISTDSILFLFCVSFMVQFLSVFVQELVCFFYVMKFVGREFVIISNFSCSFLTGEFSGLSFKVVVLFV